jgi:DNA replication protein DnaC
MCKLVQANVPKKYWDFTLRNLIKEFIRENNQVLALIDGYVNQVDEMIKEGVGLYIEGVHGLAKTALSCYIIKQFLRADKEAYFIRMSNLTHLVFDSIKDETSREKLLWIRKRTHLLVVDEIEKDYKISDEATFSGAAISEIFDEIYETKKCLIITSNVTKDKLAKTHAESVVDRIMELVDIPLVGKGYRSTVDKKSLIIKGIKK